MIAETWFTGFFTGTFIVMATVDWVEHKNLTNNTRMVGLSAVMLNALFIAKTIVGA